MSHHGHHHPIRNNGGEAVAIPLPPVLGANVLVLNKFYQAIRVINVRRAFSLLCRDLAEVVHIETDAQGQSKWQNFDFADWRELSQLKAEFEPDEYDWIHTVRFQIAVPRIIRLLGYDKLPRQDVKFNRRNIYARDEPLPVLRQEDADDRAVAGSRGAQEPGRQEHVGKHRLLLREVQREEGRPHARAGAHAPDHQAGEAEAQPGDQHPPGRRAVLELEAVPGYGVLDGRAEVRLRRRGTRSGRSFFA